MKVHQRRIEILGLLLGLLLTGNWEALSQQKPLTSPHVSNYVRFLENQIDDKGLKSRIKSLPVSAVKHAARLLYDATENDPRILRKEIDRKHEVWDSVYAKQKSAEGLGWKIGAVEKMYLDEIERVLSKRVYALVRVPYVLQVVISSLERTQYGPSAKRRGYVRTVVTATVGDVLKGMNRFSPREVVKFYYNDFWIKTPDYFRVGDTCLVLLDPRESPDGNDKWLAVVTYLDDSFGYHVIRNGILHDVHDTFGFGSHVAWQSFRDSVLAQINTIKVW